MESITDEIERRAEAVLGELDALGGAVAAIERGVPQRWIAESAYRIERDIADGTRPRVGVNVHVDEGEETASPELFTLDPKISGRQVARTAARIAARDQNACVAAIEAVGAAAREGRNVMPPLVDAVRVGATLGELSDIFREVFGEFREPNPW